MTVARQISEADWKLFRRVHEVALERFCERVLSELGRLAAKTEPSAHERYLAVYKLLQGRDKELTQAFDDLKRSTAWPCLALMRSRRLVTDEEFAGFSSETQAAVQLWMGG
jgi:hypothetical protein